LCNENLKKKSIGKKRHRHQAHEEWKRVEEELAVKGGQRPRKAISQANAWRGLARRKKG